MNFFALDELLSFSEASPAKNIFFESDRIKAQVMGLEAGQVIPPCRMENDVIFVILSGEGTMLVDGEEQPYRASSFFFVPREAATRSMQAGTKTAVLAVQVKT